MKRTKKKEDESIVETDCTLNLLLIAKLAMRCCTPSIFTLSFSIYDNATANAATRERDETQLFKLVATIELCTRNKVQHVLCSLGKSFCLATHFSPFHFSSSPCHAVCHIIFALLRRRSSLGSEKFEHRMLNDNENVIMDAPASLKI